MKKINLISLTVGIILLGSYSGFKFYAEAQAKKEIDKSIAEAASYADVKYGNLSVDVFNLNVHIGDIVVTSKESNEKISINEIVVYEVDRASRIPTFLNIAINGINIKIDDLSNDAKKLKDLGYKDSISLNTAIQYHYDDKQKEFDLSTHYSADKMGVFDFNLKLGNLVINQEKIFETLMTYPTIMIHHASMSYDDDSFMTKLFKQDARKKQKTVAEVKQALIQDIDSQIAKHTNEFTEKLLVEIKSFIQNPNKIAITIAPEKPLEIKRLMRLNNPKDLPKLLNVKIKAS